MRKHSAMVAPWLCILAVLAFCQLATATTIATFEDPTVGVATSDYMFDAVDGAGGTGTISGSWTGAGLDLAIPGVLGAAGYQDVIFEFAATPYTGTCRYGADVGQGWFRFVDSSNNQEILRVDFNSAFFTRWGLAADNFDDPDNVKFTVFGTQKNLEDEAFSFGFANVNFLPSRTSPTELTSTAAFSSSAEMPEPASLALLLLGGAAILRRR